MYAIRCRGKLTVREVESHGERATEGTESERVDLGVDEVLMNELAIALDLGRRKDCSPE